MRVVNATREDITAALRAGLSNSAVSRRLRCDKKRVQALRAELGLPVTPAQPLTLVEKWTARTREVEGGHLEWTGQRQRPSGTPVMVYSGRTYTAARIAYRIRTGRDPEGYAMPTCAMAHCVAPDHQDDEADRARVREQLRYLTGGRPRPPRCRHGHDQAKHGRYGPGGVAYCEACKVVRRRADAGS
jgi:hypothetical protein